MSTPLAKFTSLSFAVGLALAGCTSPSDGPPSTGVDKAPTHKAPTDKAPTDKAPTGKAPTDKAPTGKAPTGKAPSDGPPPDRAPASVAPASKAPAAPTAVQPKGVVNGQPFEPAAVLLIQASSGEQTLHFYDQPSDAVCQAPFPGRVKTMLAFIAGREKPYAVGGPYTQADGLQLYFSIGGASPPDQFEAAITFTEADAASNRLRGNIRYKGADGTTLTGAFTGDYCPTKAKVRTEAPPVHGLAWTMDAVAPDTLPAAPAQGALAGLPFSPAHVSVHGAGDQTKMYFFATTPKDACSTPASGRVVTRVAGVKIDEAPTGARIDTFEVRLKDPAVLATGGRLAARSGDATSRKRAHAAIHFYEADGNRAIMYSQFFSLALAIDGVDEAAKTIKGRIYAAVKDSGLSMVVGGFTATRCPAK